MAGIPIDPKRFLTAAATPVIKSVATEFRLRDADLKTIRFAGVDKEIHAALDTLSQNAANARLALVQFLKGKISDRPEVFDEPPVPQWLQTDKVCDLIKTAIYALIDEQDIQPIADEAAAFFAEFDGADGPGRGYAAFEYAVPYVALSIANSLDTGQRLILDAVRDVRDRVDSSSGPIPQALLDSEIDKQLETLRRGRFLEGFGLPELAQRLASRIDGGELSRASGNVRAVALATCARYLARGGVTEDAQRFLDASIAILATEEAVIARAAMLANTDVDAALAELAPIDNEARRLAALGVVARKENAEAIVDWADAAGIDRTLLDSDGKHVLLFSRVEAGRWDEAFEDAAAITATDFERTPALGHVVAITHVAHVLPNDLRHVILRGPPFDPANFPLSDTPASLAERRLAAELSRNTSDAARALGAGKTADFLATFALWLELRDPVTQASAKARLAASLDGEDPILWVPLAIAFGLITDLAPIEKAVDRATALNPKGSDTIAQARLTMAFAQPSPSDAADYLARHRALMGQNLSVAEVNHFEIELLIGADRIADAQARLEASRNLFDADRIRHIESQLRSGPAGATLAQLEAAYAATPSTTNLAQLVGNLAAQGYSERFFTLARQMVAVTPTVSAAEGVMRVLLQHKKWSEISTLLGEIPELIDPSRLLRTAQAWNQYMQGNLSGAAATLAPLRTEADDPSLRSLHLNLLIVSGRWPEIAAWVEEEWAKRAERSPGELLALAQLARQVGSSRVRELIAMAASLAPQDPHILARSYVLGTQAGLDDSAEMHGWLEQAAALSGEDGPIQKATLAELVAEQPDWDRRTTDVWSMLRAGTLPLHIGARLLRRPSLELRLGAMIGNLREGDPRRRSAVPAFSGVRGLPKLEAGTIGLDGSALITLGVLGLVSEVIARGGVTIPHNMLGWLFQERQRLAFHQPSRIAFAHRLQRELTNDRLRRFAPATAVDGKLADAVGHSLAAMLAAAMAKPEGAGQRVVVRSSPVERIGTFRGETVDLERFADVMCSCQRVIDKLVEAGQLTDAEERHARTYLEANEQRWSPEPEIEDGADLYLDDLSVSYLNTAGVLDKLHGAGVRVHVSDRQIEETNALSELEAQSAEIDRIIDDIRASLSKGIEDGAVTLSPLADEEEDLKQHPDLRIVDLAGSVDVLVADDRFTNRHRRIDSDAGSSPVWSSLDLMAMLGSEARISETDLLAHRTTLRRAGFVLFPMDTDELCTLIAAAKLREGELLETAELRAIRENMQLAQMRRFLSLPDETTFLETTSRAAVEATTRQWSDAVPDGDARARSRWLMARADLRDWAGALPADAGGGLATRGLAISISTLLTHRLDVAEEARDRFDAWLSEELLQPLKERDPKVYAWLIANLRTIIIAVSEGAISDPSASDGHG